MIIHWLAILVDTLLIPDLIALFALLAFTLLHLGGFVGELVTRLRGIHAFVPTTLEYHDERTARHRIESTQAHMLHSLERLSLGIRLGPVLGLAGTLIPLGPALVAFGKGDLGALANQLAIAFHATVVGLLIGGVCYAMQLARRRWYRLDLIELETALHQQGTNEVRRAG